MSCDNRRISAATPPPTDTGPFLCMKAQLVKAKFFASSLVTVEVIALSENFHSLHSTNHWRQDETCWINIRTNSCVTLDKKKSTNKNKNTMKTKFIQDTCSENDEVDNDIHILREMFHVKSNSTTGWLLPPSQKQQQDQQQQQDQGQSVESAADTFVVINCALVPTRAITRNRKGMKCFECHEVLELQTDVDSEELRQIIVTTATTATTKILTTSPTLDSPIIFHNKRIRHELFADWLIDKFGKSFLCSGSGVLDVAGGKGELGDALFRRDVPSILLDPMPRCDPTAVPFSVIAQPLQGDGSQLMSVEGTDADLVSSINSKRSRTRIASQIAQSSILTGMHPDQATEAIVDTCLRLNKPFAILPCCVMPKLFPNRMQKRFRQPVRSHSTFCQYLLDKAPPGYTFQVDYLPFDGRNQIIYFDFKCHNINI